MDYFPLFADLTNRPVLVVGGGAVAERKIRLLLQAHAAVTMIAPRVSPTLKHLADTGALNWQARVFNDDDLTAYRLVFAATNNATVNRRVFALAEAAGKLVNTVDQKELCTFISPAIVDRSPVIVAISTGGTSPVLARRLRTWLEKNLPRRLGQVALFAASMRERVKTAITAFTPRRLFWEQVLDGPVHDLLVADREPEARQYFDVLLHEQRSGSAKRPLAPGLVAIVGAGPGDAGLLTLRALQLMQQADVILHDKLVSAEVLDLCRRDADLIDVGKRAGNHRLQQEQINQLLVSHVLQGKRVVRLKGGDPFIFGRGGEELLALADAGIAAEVVPGISAANACAAAMQIPLTHRQLARSVTYVTAHCEKSIDCIDWSALTGTDRTLAIYMGVGQIRTIQAQLMHHGLAASTPWAIIENGGNEHQRLLSGTLDAVVETVLRERVQAPAMLIIGEAAAIPQEIAARQQYHHQRKLRMESVCATA